MSQSPIFHSSIARSFSGPGTTYSTRRAKLIADQELARLKPEQLKQQKEVEHKAKDCKELWQAEFRAEELSLHREHEA